MNENTLWMDAINKKMENLKVDFEIIDDVCKIQVGNNKDSSHLAFDIRMMLERKACRIKDGHNIPKHNSSILSIVVSIEIIRILLTHAAPNDVPMCTCNVQNACLQVLSSEKNYVICCTEFGLDNVGEHATIVHVLCGD